MRIFTFFVRLLLNVNPSLNQTPLTFLLYVRKTWMTHLILAIYFPLMQKDAVSYACSCTLCEKGLPFARDLSLENPADYYLCFGWFYFNNCLTSFSSINHQSISSDIYEVFSINPSANVFVWRHFNVRHKDWLTYSGGTD